jgi:hypothetical protein
VGSFTTDAYYSYYLSFPFIRSLLAVLNHALSHMGPLCFSDALVMNDPNTFPVAGHNSLPLQPFLCRFPTFSIWHLPSGFIIHAVLRGEVY